MKFPYAKPFRSSDDVFGFGLDKKIKRLTNTDKYGHIWIDRGTCVCPFKCKKCGALSGTDNAFKSCSAAPGEKNE